MKKAAPQYQQSSPTQGQHSADEAFELLKKRMFPERARHCFECNTRLTSSNRKRMVTFHNVPGMGIASPYQVCKRCAALLQSEQLHLLPKINADLMAARFGAIGNDVECVGGVQ